jgi:tRNA-specific 2-thiouridylase
MRKTALIAMSGGVDSSVAAYLMKENGFGCVGVTMKLFGNADIGGNGKTCCSQQDAEDARSVAFRLDIPFHAFNFTDDFKKQVIGRFAEAYQSGATPNPCIDCNRYMKFDKLYERAKLLDMDYIATGHYARTERDGGGYVLKKASDTNKDQSYVLFFLTQEHLKRTLFPLGSLHKHEVRRIAAEQGFLNAQKRESQDICFVPDGDYAKFIERHTDKTFPCGDFIDSNNNVLGEHQGIIRYTIGQRKGLGLALPCPMYVKSKNADNNTVTLCVHDDLFSKTLHAADFNWITTPPSSHIRVKAKIRYNQIEQPATAERISDSTVRVDFDEPQRAIAKGQAVVLYDGDIVLGGGTIFT